MITLVFTLGAFGVITLYDSYNPHHGITYVNALVSIVFYFLVVGLFFIGIKQGISFAKSITIYPIQFLFVICSGLVIALLIIPTLFITFTTSKKVLISAEHYRIERFAIPLESRTHLIKADNIWGFSIAGDKLDSGEKVEILQSSQCEVVADIDGTAKTFSLCDD